MEEKKADFREERLKTDIDRLLDLVKKRKEISFPDASKTLKVSELQVEDWGNILEEHGYAKLHYPLMGDPVVRDIGISETKQEKVKAKPTVKGLTKARGKRLKKAGPVLTLGILLIFFGYVFMVDNPNTQNAKNQFTNLYIILTGNMIYLAILVIIIIAVPLLILMRKRFKHKKGKKAKRKEQKKAKAPKPPKQPKAKKPSKGKPGGRRK